MKIQMASAWRRGWLFALLLGVLLVGLFLTQGSACQFWGVIGTPSVGGGNQTVYDAAVARLPVLASNNNSDNGWSVTDYRPNQSVRILRDRFSIYNPVPTAYTDRCNLARDQGAVCVMAHARNDWGSAYQGINNPHPFVYPNLFGRHTYSFIHNGTINSTCLGQLEDSLGPGWAATRLFYNGHQGSQFTWWGDATQHRRLDSEYYGMLLAKWLLIGENYYWPATTPASIHSAEEYAINRVLDKIARGLGDSRFNSLNALLGCESDIWMLYRRTTADDNTDPDFLHYLSYYIGAPTTVREASTTLIAGADWTRLSVQGQSKCIWLNPNFAITNEDVPIIETDPTELRINQLDYADHSQMDPAIAGNPVDGNFLTVWASSGEGNIWCRVYNQMGTSEFGQMAVNSSSVPGTSRTQPAVAFNLEGDRGMIVWKERPAFGTGDYTIIKGRRFTWDAGGSNFNWLENERFLTTTQLTVDHPTVACIGKGFMAAWHAGSMVTMGLHIRYSLECNDFTVTDQVLVGTPVDHFTKPDVCVIDPHRYVIVYEKDVPAPGNDMLQTSQIGVDPGWMGRPMDLRETVSPSVQKTWPCIARLTDSRFVVGYNNFVNRTCIAAEIYDAPSGGPVSWVSAVRGTDPNITGPSDIAVLSPDVFYISYAVSNSATRETDVWAARRSGGLFVDPLRLNDITTSNQANPVLAVAHGFGPAANQQLYDGHSTTQYFDDHRLAIWQSNLQDGSEFGIVGKYQGIAPNLALKDWNTVETFDNAGHVPCTDLLLLAEGGTGALDGSEIAPVENKPVVAIPTATALYPAYPNPFNPTTMLRFDLNEAAQVHLEVFDLAGRLMSTLVNEEYPAGSFAVRFDGSAITSGTYFVRLRAGTVVQMQKVLLVK